MSDPVRNTTTTAGINEGVLIALDWEVYGRGGKVPEAGDTLRVLLPVYACAFPETDADEAALVAGGYTNDQGEWIKNRTAPFTVTVQAVRFLPGSQGAQWEVIDPAEPLAESFFLDRQDVTDDGKLPFELVASE